MRVIGWQAGIAVIPMVLVGALIFRRRMRWLQALLGNSYYPEIQNLLPAKQNTCYRVFWFLSKGSRIHDRAPRGFPFGPEPRRPIPVDGRVAGDAERVAPFRSGTPLE